MLLANFVWMQFGGGHVAHSTFIRFLIFISMKKAAGIGVDEHSETKPKQ